MDWILFWQIAGPIIGVAGITVPIVLYNFSRREKLEIRHANMSVQLKTN